MDDLRLLGVGGDRPGDTVVETHADGDKQVALLREDIGSKSAVHAEHAGIMGIVAIQCAESEHGGAGGDVALVQEAGEFLLGYGWKL